MNALRLSGRHAATLRNCVGVLGQENGAVVLSRTHVLYQQQQSRPMTDRASGPGGLFKSARRTINPWVQEQKALRLRLRAARQNVEAHLQQHHQQQDGTVSEENKFEDESDIVNMVERQIEEMMRRGAFDNLRNKGRPLPTQPQTTMELCMRMMRDNGLRPPWLQLMHDIDAETRIMRGMMVEARLKYLPKNQRQWLRSCNVAGVRIDEINRMIDSFNLQKPFSIAHVFRLRLRLDDEMKRAVRESVKVRQSLAAAKADVDRTKDDGIGGGGGTGLDMVGWRKLLLKLFR